MAMADYYNRYVWLMNTLLRERKITFEDIAAPIANRSCPDRHLRRF